jgi:hypothetical protein
MRARRPPRPFSAASVPVAGAALRCAGETKALQFKLLPDERIQVRAAHDHIPAKHPRRAVPHLKLHAQRVIDFAREESDLPFVVVFEAKEAVAFDPLPCHQPCLRDFLHRRIARRLPVVAEVVVRPADVDVLDGHAAPPCAPPVEIQEARAGCVLPLFLRMMALPAGFEPATDGLENRCSIR